MLSKKSILILLVIVVVVIGYKNRYTYFQKVNTAYLIDANQSYKVFPHRVNSVGKLKDIWDVGFRCFEIDTYFGDEKTNYFKIGHDESRTSSNLDNLLSSIEHKQIKRIWLDFKNLNENNYQNALNRLKYLDNKFHIKDKIIIETGTTLDFFKKFKNDGWHTSYYLPTGEILKLLEDKNIEELKKTASKIAIQSKTQNLSAISFDSKLYTFVKQYLEPLINKDIVYHTWWGPKLYKYNFRSKLQNNQLFLDKRVKTILVRFKSPHHL